MAFYPGFKKEEMISYPLPDGWMCLQAKDKPIQFHYRYNHSNDTMIEFAVFEGEHAERCVGKGAQFTLNPQQWIDSFVFAGTFNVWIRERRVKVV